jgi:hypothetical protein
MKKTIFSFCCCILISISFGCQTSTPRALGTSGNGKAPLQLEVVLPKDIYTGDLFSAATKKSMDPMRGQKFDKELRKLIANPSYPKHFLAANQPIPYIIRNISKQRVFFCRRFARISIELETSKGSKKIVCRKREREKENSNGYASSFTPPYTEYDCITVLEPGEFIAGVVMPGEYKDFPIKKNRFKEWRLCLKVQLFDLPIYHLEKIDMKIFKGTLVSNKVEVMILRSEDMVF